jgi:lipoprotein-anchoring transpeptidase ErfK/SrfK
MPEINKANRQVCDVDIRFLKTMAPFLFFDTANTTTAGLSGDSVYAMKKGTRAIAFHNPIEGTMSIEAQVMPFKAYALFSDGIVESTAAYATKKTIKCTTAGQLAITDAVAGTVFVYPVGEYGDELKAITGTYASGTFTAATEGDIAVDTDYEVGYVVSKSTGVKKVSFNKNKVPNDYYITMSTLDKGEDDTLTPFIMTAYKASIQRTFELSFASEGEPATVTINFDLMEDKNGNILDIIEDTTE